jgi:hypothetical protein
MPALGAPWWWKEDRNLERVLGKGMSCLHQVEGIQCSPHGFADVVKSIVALPMTAHHMLAS